MQRCTRRKPQRGFKREILSVQVDKVTGKGASGARGRIEGRAKWESHFSFWLPEGEQSTSVACFSSRTPQEKTRCSFWFPFFNHLTRDTMTKKDQPPISRPGRSRAATHRTPAFPIEGLADQVVQNRDLDLVVSAVASPKAASASSFVAGPCFRALRGIKLKPTILGGQQFPDES